LQVDTEHADLDLDHTEIKNDEGGERKNLAAIHVSRGLDPALRKQMAFCCFPRARATVKTSASYAAGMTRAEA